MRVISTALTRNSGPLVGAPVPEGSDVPAPASSGRGRRSGPGLLQRWSVWALIALVSCVSLTWSSPAQAYAWMIRHGYAQCITCHTDPSGGETLSHMGRVTSQTLLSQQFGASDGPTDSSRLLFGVPEPDFLRVGGSFRSLALYQPETEQLAAFPMQADVYANADIEGFLVGLSVGASRSSGRYEHTDKASLVIDPEGDQFVPVSRSHWLGYRATDSLMIRLGRLNLPFGIRTSAHTQWVRDATLTDRESDQQHGLAVAYFDKRLRFEVMGVAGNLQLKDADAREQGYSGYLEYSLIPKLAVGVSSQLMIAKRGLYSGLPDEMRHAHGLTLRYSPFPLLAVLVEADALFQTHRDPGMVALATIDLEPTQGLHFELSGEALDRGARADLPSATPADQGPFPDDIRFGPGAGEPVFGGWVGAAWFPLPHVDVRVDAVMRQERPLTVMAQGHFYF